MTERENSRVGIYYALYVGLFIFCLVGAFTLPPSITSSRVLGWFGLVGLFAIPILVIFATRSRIRNAVEERDGTLISMKRIWRFTPGYWRYRSLARTRIELEYIDAEGATHRALCNSGWFSGVEWLEDEVVSDEPPPHT
ncbi:MAG TPA: hypothetical protein VMR33_02050 [Candidatus Baltobacteraceae bacterium]|jgi:hypothetical protein|nr:hypothetical protein [Candidatus Baltobacteraceae bacterium]